MPRESINNNEEALLPDTSGVLAQGLQTEAARAQFSGEPDCETDHDKWEVINKFFADAQNHNNVVYRISAGCIFINLSMHLIIFSTEQNADKSHNIMHAIDETGQLLVAFGRLYISGDKWLAPVDKDRFNIGFFFIVSGAVLGMVSSTQSDSILLTMVSPVSNFLAASLFFIDKLLERRGDLVGARPGKGFFCHSSIFIYFLAHMSVLYNHPVSDAVSMIIQFTSRPSLLSFAGALDPLLDYLGAVCAFMGLIYFIRKNAIYLELRKANKLFSDVPADVQDNLQSEVYYKPTGDGEIFLLLDALISKLDTAAPICHDASDKHLSEIEGECILATRLLKIYITLILIQSIYLSVVLLSFSNDSAYRLDLVDCGLKFCVALGLYPMALTDIKGEGQGFLIFSLSCAVALGASIAASYYVPDFDSSSSIKFGGLFLSSAFFLCHRKLLLSEKFRCDWPLFFLLSSIGISFFDIDGYKNKQLYAISFIFMLLSNSASITAMFTLAKLRASREFFTKLLFKLGGIVSGCLNTGLTLRELHGFLIDHFNTCHARAESPPVPVLREGAASPVMESYDAAGQPHQLGRGFI